MQTLKRFFSRVQPDRFLLISGLVVIAFGLLVFLSAALSVISKNPAQFTRMLIGHVGLGLVGGTIAGIAAYIIDPQVFKKASPYVLGLGVLATALVFVPGLGMSHGGATRWISLGFITLQPAELLKVGIVLFPAFLFSTYPKSLQNIRQSFIWVVAIIGILGGILLAQPDTGTWLVITATVAVIYFTAGAKLKHLAIAGLLGIIAMASLVAMRPYLLDRIQTFFDPARDPLGASYQIRQAFIAAGSGQLWGRGIGQSVQKFRYLPEPAGDAVFAVWLEEAGFIGGVLLLGVLFIFIARGIWVAKRARNQFERLVAMGIVSLFAVQMFLNIFSIIGLFPMTGLPLPFVSHGGTALLVNIVLFAMLLRISAHAKKDKPKVTVKGKQKKKGQRLKIEHLESSKKPTKKKQKPPKKQSSKPRVIVKKR